MARGYENGVRDGKTEATFEGLAFSMDQLREEGKATRQALSALPCRARGATIRAMWVIVTALLFMLIGVVLKVVFS